MKLTIKCYLTLTSVVFEFNIDSNKYYLYGDLTLTSVVFEFLGNPNITCSRVDLTLTSVVFEFSRAVC